MTDEEELQRFEERAAIMEYDGGLPRDEAEVAAYFEWRKGTDRSKAVPVAIVEIHRRAKESLKRRGK